MTFCPTYGLALKVVDYYKKHNPHCSIDIKNIKEYWSNTWLFTEYGFRIPSEQENLFSIDFSSHGFLALASQGKLFKTIWSLKVEESNLKFLKDQVDNALSYNDIYKIDCRASSLFVSKGDMQIIKNHLKGKGKT